MREIERLCEGVIKREREKHREREIERKSEREI